MQIIKQIEVTAHKSFSFYWRNSLFNLCISRFFGLHLSYPKEISNNSAYYCQPKKVAATNLVTGLCGIYYSFFDDITEPLTLFVAILIIVVYFIRTFYVRHVTIAADRIIEEQAHEEE